MLKRDLCPLHRPSRPFSRSCHSGGDLPADFSPGDFGVEYVKDASFALLPLCEHCSLSPESQEDCGNQEGVQKRFLGRSVSRPFTHLVPFLPVRKSPEGQWCFSSSLYLG